MKASGAGTRIYFYDAFGNPILESANAQGAWLAAHAFFNGRHVYENTGQLLWRHVDHLGSAVVRTDVNGGKLGDWRYYPFGERAVGSAAVDPYEFTGKERDAETGLDYFGARYYGGALGRFTSPDPLLSSGRPENPQSWNRYTYVLNNPLRNNDPTGLFEWDATLGGIYSDRELRRNAGRERELRARARAVIDQRKAIRKELNRLAKSKDSTLSGAAAAIGAEGVNNGVMIGMGAISPGAAAQVEVERPLSIDVNGNPLVDLRIQEGAAGAALFIMLAHEGTHIADAQSVASGLRPVVWHFETELRAYQATIAAARAVGWNSVGPAGGSPFWSSSWTKTDQQTRPAHEILRFLREEPLYSRKLFTPAFTR